jgi:hypothetical protein
MTGAVRVELRHLRALGYCSRGARAWFAHHALDWQAFVADGLPAEVIEATGDHFGIEAAKRARMEAASHG